MHRVSIRIFEGFYIATKNASHTHKHTHSQRYVSRKLRNIHERQKLNKSLNLTSVWHNNDCNIFWFILLFSVH